MENCPVFPLFLKMRWLQKLSFPVPRFQPTLVLGVCIFSPYWVLICGKGQLGSFFLIQWKQCQACGCWHGDWEWGFGCHCLWVVGLKENSVHWEDPRIFSTHKVRLKGGGWGWRGISLYWLEQDKKGKLALWAGALGRRYIAFDVRKIWKIIVESINCYFSSLHFQKKTSLMCFLIQIHVTAFSETKLNSYFVNKKLFPKNQYSVLIISLFFNSFLSQGTKKSSKTS